MTKAELKALITYMADADDAGWTGTHIDQFIQMAEATIYTSIEAPRFRTTITDTVSAGNPTYILIGFTNATDIYSFKLRYTSKDWKTLRVVDRSFLDEWETDEDIEGIPKYYAEDYGVTNYGGSSSADSTYEMPDTTIALQTRYILSPTPGAIYAIEIQYNGYPPSITTGDDNYGNWISIINPNCLVYGALMHGYTALKGELPLIEKYKEMFSSELGQIKLLMQGRSWSDAYAMGESE